MNLYSEGELSHFITLKQNEIIIYSGQTMPPIPEQTMPLVD